MCIRDSFGIIPPAILRHEEEPYRELVEIPESDRARHLDLLLIADESVDMIERLSLIHI